MIPFKGPSDREHWTGGIKPDISFDLNILGDDEARKALPDGDWNPYIFVD